MTEKKSDSLVEEYFRAIITTYGGNNSSEKNDLLLKRMMAVFKDLKKMYPKKFLSPKGMETLKEIFNATAQGKFEDIKDPVLQETARQGLTLLDREQGKKRVHIVSREIDQTLTTDFIEENIVKITEILSAAYKNTVHELQPELFTNLGLNQETLIRVMESGKTTKDRNQPTLRTYKDEEHLMAKMAIKKLPKPNKEQRVKEKNSDKRNVSCQSNVPPPPPSLNTYSGTSSVLGEQSNVSSPERYYTDREDLLPMMAASVTRNDSKNTSRDPNRTSSAKETETGKTNRLRGR